MSIAFHGNWCGPGWTAGKRKDARELTEADRRVPAIDQLDQACKEHDIGLHDNPEDAERLNEEFIQQAQQQGIKGRVAATAVRYAGPKPMTRRNIRDRRVDADEDDNEWQQHEQQRSRGIRQGQFNINRQSREQLPWEREDVSNSSLQRAAREARRPENRPDQVINDAHELIHEVATDVLAPWEGTQRNAPNTENDIELDMLVQDANDAFPDSLSNSQPTTLDDLMTDIQAGGGDEPMPEAARAAAAGGGASQVSKETPITIAQPSYGLQETHTTILPYNTWFSVGAPDYSNDCVYSIRCNSIQDMIISQVATLAPAAQYIKKVLYNVPFNNLSTGLRSASGGATLEASVFPQAMAAGANTTEQAFWTKYWATLYEYYTVLGMEYEITVRNVQTTQQHGGLIAIDFDSYSDTAGATGNKTPSPVTLAEYMSFRDVRWHYVTGGSTLPWEGKNQTTIKGVYRPGQIKRNISNDGDVKTWTKIDYTTPQLPTLKDILNIRFFKDPLSGADNQGTDGKLGNQAQFNCQVKLKYLVQFKDLREAARYPYTTNGVTLTNVIPTDVVQTIGA